MARGRPRKTTPEKVLEQAMKIFWERGFDATSMNDIAQETGMAKPGLYTAFGDKEKLYQQAISHYFETFGKSSLDYLIHSPASLKTTLRTHLKEIAAFLCDESNPGGCFVVNGVIDCAHKTGPLEEYTRFLNQKRREAFYMRLKRAKAEGELPDDADIDALADFFGAQPISLAVMARAKTPFSALENLIETSLKVLPENDL